MARKLAAYSDAPFNLSRRRFWSDSFLQPQIQKSFRRDAVLLSQRMEFSRKIRFNRESGRLRL
jgi:hypothetical protein